MTYRGIFVDDEDDVYADLLSKPGQLSVEFAPVEEVSSFARHIFEASPDVVAVDYRLDEVLGAISPDKVFKGSALAQHLRDFAIEFPDKDFPIVLVSAEAKVQSLFNPDKTAHDLFDRVYLKEDVRGRRDLIIDELQYLCASYVRLRACRRPYDLTVLMAAREEDLPALNFQELRAAIDSAAAPHVFVRLFLRNIIDRSGILVSERELGARLGLEADIPTEVLTSLEDAGVRYTGLFCGPQTRWWSHRVDTWSHQIFGRRYSAITSGERAEALGAAIGKELAAAKSTWTGRDDELIAFACASCQRGAELKHSVAAFEGALPRYVSRRRICWDCIQTDAYERANLTIDDTDASLAEAVRHMER